MRTEEQKITQEPIVAKIGDKEYSIPLLTIKRSRVWKKQWWEAINGSNGYNEAVAKISNKQSPEDMAEALNQGFYTLLIGQTETVIDLVMEYVNQSGAELTREIIEDEATEADIAVLWGQINEVAFPLVTSLANAMTLNR